MFSHVHFRYVFFQRWLIYNKQSFLTLFRLSQAPFVLHVPLRMCLENDRHPLLVDQPEFSIETSFGTTVRQRGLCCRPLGRRFPAV